MNLEHARAYDEAMKVGDFDAASKALCGLQSINNRMGLAVVRRDENSMVMTMELSEEVEGSAQGSVHGGMLATFADIASAMALRNPFDKTIPVTTEMHVRYYRQPAAGPLTAAATIVHHGRRFVGTECRIVDAHQRVLARTTATYIMAPFDG